MAKEEAKLVKLVIDDVAYEVPEGMNLVDAAKMCGVEIPVFCYHPKLGHAANCRVCLVELATPRRNRDTGEMELAWFPDLQTSCNRYVTDGMTIKTATDAVKEGRRAILEFLLSSHPLDCPICDKGGECPLQNLTMAYGPATSRMYWEEKQHLGKHIPLGDLIYLDQERCIHCARCIRFEELIADDPVLNFDYRGRKQRIITSSEPPFDSIFSGNTTDICPVGALTSVDFRFNARPWEMNPVATLDTYGPEGANMSFDTRVDREAGGVTVIKRVMPRQNEAVNEIWISDKSRFGRHYFEHPDRLAKPMMRKGGLLVEVEWEEALAEAERYMTDAGDSIGAIAGPRISNEDAFALQRFIRSLGSGNLAVYPARMAGADIAAKAGVGVDTDIQKMGKGDAIIVAASDLHEEAPIYWLRVKAAAQRGANLIVINGRETRLDKFAAESIRYSYGEEVAAFDKNETILRALKEAEDAVIFIGGEGIGPETTEKLAASAANMLSKTGHIGKANNGLIMVWPGANTQGAFDMGASHQWGPGYTLASEGLGFYGMMEKLKSGEMKVILIDGADPAFGDMAADEALRATNAFIIVMDMFLTETAELADLVLPTQSIAERMGTYTSAERRVQRFYQAIDPVGESKADWEVIAAIESRLGLESLPASEPAIFRVIADAAPAYADMSYIKLTETVDQMPDVGGDDRYYGGAAFQNEQGTGFQWAAVAESGEAWSPLAVEADPALTLAENEILAVPVTVFYDREAVLMKSAILAGRIPEPFVKLNPLDGGKFGLMDGDEAIVALDKQKFTVAVSLDVNAPEGVMLFPRMVASGGGPLAAAPAAIQKLENSEA